MRAQRVLYMALNPAKNKPLAQSANTGYNKKNGGSYTGSTTGFNVEKSPLKTTTTNFAAPKKTTITPKKTEENYFTKARETQRELSKPLPRINDAPKVNLNKYGITPDKDLTPSDDSWYTGNDKTDYAWKADEKTLTNDYAKKYDLPDWDQRNMAMGAFGEKQEKLAYQRMLNDVLNPKPKKTDDELFRAGFLGEEENEPVKNWDLKEDFGIGNYEMPKGSHMREFAEEQYAKSHPKQTAQFHAAYKPEEKKVELDPNVRIIPTPKADYTKEWRAAYKPDVQSVHDANRTEMTGMYRNMADASEIIGYAEKPYEMLETATKETAKIAGEYDEALKTVDWLDDSSNFKFVKSTRKLASSAKAIGYAGIVLDAGAIYAERMDEGYDQAEAAGRAVVNAGTKAVLSWGCTKGGTALGAKIGTLISPGLGTAIGAGIGFLGGLLVDLLWGDDIADQIEDNVYTTTSEEDRNLIFAGGKGE